MSDDAVHDIRVHPVHLGLGASVVPMPAFDGSSDWYARYGQQTAADGTEGRLVSMFTFDESWDMWEMHPQGHELVLCVQGTIVLHQERDGEPTTVTLEAGQYAVNEPGTWHTADVVDTATAVFITAGIGTEHRPR